MLDSLGGAASKLKRAAPERLRFGNSRLSFPARIRTKNISYHPAATTRNPKCLNGLFDKEH